MSSLEKIQEGFFNHVGTAAALAVTGLVGWLALQIAPSILPAIEHSVSTKILLAILLLSMFLNVALAVAIWRFPSRQTELRLKYGILWDKDKNPHCPVCKNGGLNYNEWNYGQLGYYCNSCEQVFGLKDASGKDVKPVDAIQGL